MNHVLFLSHAGIDREAAQTLAKRLEASPEARAQGLEVWIDSTHLGGGRWKDRLQAALSRSTAFAVYVGSKGVVNWVWDEVSVALDRVHQDAAYPLVPILAAGADVDVLPSLLSQFQGFANVERDGDAFNHLLRAVLRLDVRAHIEAEAEPFAGLKSFDSSNMHLFFGRTAETEQLLALLRAEHLVMVVGDSGSGKSSLVKAGLVPAFRGGRLGRANLGPDETIWYVIETRPGGNPFVSLANAVREAAQASSGSPKAASEAAELVRTKHPTKIRDAIMAGAPSASGRATKILLVVDQFEEFRNSPDADIYLDVLVQVADPNDDHIRVVLTMRRDYYYLCSDFSPLYDRLERNERRARYHLRRIEPMQIASCVTEPLRLAGTDKASRDALAEMVLRDVGDEPGELALLQMALSRTWKERKAHGGDLLKAYGAIGRVDGALAKAAEQVFNYGLTPHEQTLTESLFARLVRPGESGGATRRIAARSEFTDEKWALAAKLAEVEQERLLTLGEDTVEITHEALAKQWPRYQVWITNRPGDLRGDDLRTMPALIDDAQRWRNAAGTAKASKLAAGYTLDLYANLARRRQSWLSTDEREFVLASDKAKATEKRRKQRIDHALRWLTATSILLSGMFGFTAWTVNRKQLEAVANESRALSAIAAKELVAGNIADASALALASWPRDALDRRPQLRSTIDTIGSANRNWTRKFRLPPGTLAGHSLHSGDILLYDSHVSRLRLINSSTLDVAWDRPISNEMHRHFLFGNGQMILMDGRSSFYLVDLNNEGQRQFEGDFVLAGNVTLDERGKWFLN